MSSRIAFASLLVLGSLLAGVTVPAGQASPAYPLATGVSAPDVGFQTGVTASEPGFDSQPLAYERIRAAGATFTRVIVYWSLVAPTAEPQNWDPTDPADPNYDWGQFDSQIRNITKAGLEPLVMIYSAPRWAERCRSPIAGICNPDPEAFAEFSEAAAKRYDGDFQGLPEARYWEPWNEPNLFLFFEPQYKNGRKVSPVLYRDLLNRFAGVVKRVDPKNRVVAGGLAPIERPGGIGPMDFARRMLCMIGRERPRARPGCGSRARFDIWANNPYTTGGPTHQSAGVDDVSLGDLPEMARLLVAAKRAGKIRTAMPKVPFWVTEFSWDSAPPDPGGVRMGLLTRWTAEAMYRAWRAGVSRFFWLSLRDWPRAEGLPYSETIESGLYFRGRTLELDRPKRNLKAFRFPFVAFRERSGVRIWGRTPESTPGKVALWYRRGGQWRRMGSVTANRYGVFRGLIRTRFGRDRRGLVRAKHRSQPSVPFSLKPVRDRRQPPFGRRGAG